MKRGKKYVEAAKNIDRQTLYEAADAISLVKKNATAKFDETIEAHIRTGCDGRHAEQSSLYLRKGESGYGEECVGTRTRNRPLRAR